MNGLSSRSPTTIGEKCEYRPAIRLPDSLEDKIRALCVLSGGQVTTGEYLRDLIIEAVEGRLAVVRWKSSRALGEGEGDERTTP